MKRSIFITAMLLSIWAFANDDVAYQNNNVCPSEKCDYGQGHGRDVNKMSCGYNAPARYDVCGCYDIYTTGSFIYWQAFQEAMDYASTTTNISQTFITGLDLVGVDFKYKPGFKAGLGVSSNYDNWDLYAEYTWLHLTDSRSSIRAANTLLMYNDWYAWDASMFNEPPVAESMSGRWKLNMDLFDFELARKYYVGTKLDFRPFIGMRVALIDQRMTISPEVLLNLVNIGIRELRVSSDSWGIGPRLGIDTSWHLGCGFRTIGNTAASLLYTDYKMKIFQSTINQAADTNPGRDASSKRKFLRTNFEAALGFAWGTYFSSNTYHLDFGATYDFNVFFHQNMMRYYVESGKFNKGQFSPGNLYTHGLTVNVRLDF